MLFLIAIELGDDQHAYSVAVPDLPGCFSAGDTFDEAIANARETIEGHLESLAEHGTYLSVSLPRRITPAEIL
ncbi:type II toxin-antitoxin system HicB family antitoxin [Modicisalibacter xianhensis]|uniref:Predicted nuclease of the RNAse H fold, HicB family n=1 Tax=Modicisalibacter xianhensis TaxID=442341 RepID=A0A1I3FPC2_9GAMM|nr:type II toxin-antitoxin system HicB family antitoxin [Halomonas xianhensis]SFI13118.1 Predicted nuclease of the RNAse H fold, HicB family [Halomonas xianhensis]